MVQSTVEQQVRRGGAGEGVRFLEVSSAATRREFLGMIAAAGLLVACGDDDSSGGAGSGGAGGTRTVETAHGPVDIPVRPQRVVAMHDQLVAYAVASLGFDRLIAVAARDAADPTVAIRQLGDVPPVFERLEDIGTYEAPNLEAIAALDPDLIIGLPYEVDPVYDELSAIAPTVVIDLVEDGRTPFRRQRDLAAVVGVEDELDERLADYETRREAVRAAIGDQLQGAAYTYLESFGAGPEDNWIIRSEFAPGLIVLGDLGAVPSSTTLGLTEEYNGVSLETVATFDADVIFVGLPEEGELDPQLSALLATTTAGRAGQIHTVSRDIWALEVVEALFASLRDVERVFTGATITKSGAFTG